MANLTLKLHVDGNGVSVDTRFGFTVADGIIAYTVEAGDQVTLPNYNMVRKSGNILVGWAEESGTVSDGNNVYTKYFEPAEGHVDLYPVFMALQVGGLTTATVTSVSQTSTKMTPYANLGTAEKGDADIARAQFSNDVAGRVDAYIGSDITSIVLNNMGTAISDAMNQVREEVLGSVTELGSRMDGVESDITNITGSIGRIENRVDGVESNLAIATSEMSSLSDSVGSLANRVGTIENDMVISSANTAEIFRILSLATAEIGNQQARISSLEDDIITVSSQSNDIMSALNIATIAMESRISSLDDDIFQISSTVNGLGGAIANAETEITAMGSKMELTISSVNQVSSDQRDIISSINTLDSKVESISTSWVKSIVEETNTVASVSRSCTFVLSTIVAECSCTIPTNCKFVTKLRDYKIGSDYINTFGSMGTITWYDNGSPVYDDTPVNGGTVLMGNQVTISTASIYALPVIEEDNQTLSPTVNHIAATNYGYTRVYLNGVHSAAVFDSRGTYNAEITVNALDRVQLEAKPNDGCEFVGWYKIGTNGHVIKEDAEMSDYGVVDGDALVTEMEYDFEVDESGINYAALFKGGPTIDVRNPRQFVPTDEPMAYIYTMQAQSQGQDTVDKFIEDANGDEGMGILELSNWKGLGSYVEFAGSSNTTGIAILATNRFTVEGFLEGDDMHISDNFKITFEDIENKGGLIDIDVFEQVLTDLFGQKVENVKTDVNIYYVSGIAELESINPIIFNITE